MPSLAGTITWGAGDWQSWHVERCFDASVPRQVPQEKADEERVSPGLKANHRKWSSLMTILLSQHKTHPIPSYCMWFGREWGCCRLALAFCWCFLVLFPFPCLKLKTYLNKANIHSQLWHLYPSCLLAKGNHHILLEPATKYLDYSIPGLCLEQSSRGWSPTYSSPYMKGLTAYPTEQ